jgi:hypothetical protein
VVLGSLGAFQNKRNLLRHFGSVGIVLLAATLLYLLVSRAAPGVFLAQVKGSHLAGSIARYWAPVYLALAIAAASWLSQAPRLMRLTMLTVMVSAAALVVGSGTPDSVAPLKRDLAAKYSRYQELLNRHTEANAVIIAGKRDKWTATIRRTIGMKRSPDARRGPDGVLVPPVFTASTMVDLAKTSALITRGGMPVYFFLGRDEPPTSVEIIRRELDPYRMTLKYVAAGPSASKLYRVRVRTSAARLPHGVVPPNARATPY